VEQVLLSQLLALLRMQQFAGYEACEDNPAELAAWPWQTYLQVELLLLQYAFQQEPEYAGRAAAAVVSQLYFETRGELRHSMQLLVCCLCVACVMWKLRTVYTASAGDRK
jgi:hypothetical protein